jgi:hypothetical protein
MTALRTQSKVGLGFQGSTPVTSDHRMVFGNAWRVTYTRNGHEHVFETDDRELGRFCAWAADRADDAKLIVTPLP